MNYTSMRFRLCACETCSKFGVPKGTGYLLTIQLQEEEENYWYLYKDKDKADQVIAETIENLAFGPSYKIKVTKI